MNDLQRTAAEDPDAREIYRRLQAASRGAERSGGLVSTQDFLTRHALESFLDRLTRTPHGDDFVLKGGVLLAAYGIRRPTKDVDAGAVSTDLTQANLTRVVTDVAAVAVAEDRKSVV